MATPLPTSRQSGHALDTPSASTAPCACFRLLLGSCQQSLVRAAVGGPQVEGVASLTRLTGSREAGIDTCL